jgi:hypothetical protein
LPDVDIEHPSGHGSMELYDDEWPIFLRDFHLKTCDCDCLCSEVGSDISFECGHGCSCMETPPVGRDWAQLEGLTVCNAWGWRPVYFEY